MSWERCCEECQGYGLFTVDRPPFLELQRCDSCDRFKDDDEAAVQFTRDLEAGEPWAQDYAHELLDSAVARCEATAEYEEERRSGW